jgi:biopolymer transport protein ExbB
MKKITQSLVFLSGIMALLLMASPLSVYAQDADTTEAETRASVLDIAGTAPDAQTDETAAAAAPPTGADRSLIDMFLLGGWAMYPLALLSIAGVGLVIYNGLAIRPKQFLKPEVITQLDKAFQTVDIESAKDICAKNPSAVTSIVEAGMTRILPEEFDPVAMEKAMEEASQEELAGPFVLINYLSVVATVSPMVGLLGTVSGMVKAFNTIASEGVGNPQSLANNISEALITTATGMMVGIPAMIAYFYFKNKYGKIVSRVGRIVGDLFFTLTTCARRGPILPDTTDTDADVVAD